MMPCLLGERFTLGSLFRLPSIRKNTGRHGNAMPPHGTLTPSSKAVTSLTSSFLSQILLRGSGKVNTTRVFKSRFQPFLRRYWKSPRPSTWLKILSLQNDGRRLHPPRQTHNRGSPARQTSPYPTTCTPYQSAKRLLR